MTIKLTKDTMSLSLRNIERTLDRIPRQAYNFFKNQTPKDTGNARRRTNLRGNTIFANYNYATFLDKGSSRQAPKGITAPTSEFITKLILRGIRK